MTFSLVEDRLAAPVRPGPALAPLRVEHSSRKRESALRQSLVPSLLAARLHNEAHGQFDAELFEIANVYLPRPGAGASRRADAAGARLRPRFPGLKGVSRRCSSGCTSTAPLEARPGRDRRCSRRVAAAELLAGR